MRELAPAFLTTAFSASRGLSPRLVGKREEKRRQAAALPKTPPREFQPGALTTFLTDGLLSTRTQRGQRELGRDFPALRPVVVGMAPRAARIGVSGPGRVTRLTGRNSWKQDVARFRACKSLGVAAHARESAMRIMVELGVRHPLRSYIGGSHLGQRAALWSRESMALLAGLAPKKFLRIGGSFRHPLSWSEYAYLRR